MEVEHFQEKIPLRQTDPLLTWRAGLQNHLQLPSSAGAAKFRLPMRSEQLNLNLSWQILMELRSRATKSCWIQFTGISASNLVALSNSSVSDNQSTEKRALMVTSDVIYFPGKCRKCCVCSYLEGLSSSSQRINIKPRVYSRSSSTFQLPSSSFLEGLRRVLLIPNSVETMWRPYELKLSS